jgi:hypothetical protein
MWNLYSVFTTRQVFNVAATARAAPPLPIDPPCNAGDTAALSHRVRRQNQNSSSQSPGCYHRWG